MELIPNEVVRAKKSMSALKVSAVWAAAIFISNFTLLAMGKVNAPFAWDSFVRLSLGQSFVFALVFASLVFLVVLLASSIIFIFFKAPQARPKVEIILMALGVLVGIGGFFAY